MKDTLLTICVAIIVAGSTVAIDQLQNATVTKASTFEVTTRINVQQPEFLVPPQSENTLKSSLNCDLGFYSYKEGKHVGPPDSFVQNVNKLDCRSQQILTRLAYYESTWNPNAKNGWFEGYYQIGQGSTRKFCENNGRYANDEDCALFLYNYNKFSQFQVVQVYPESFNF